jgi:S-formylglutathione hydrolase FrmB
MLMVPSAAMGRDIPVAFQGGGPHAVVLLDAFNAAPDVSNWVTAGNAMNTLAGQGISVAAPAGGAWSMYTNWEQDGSKQWETFLANELPDWLAANKGLAPFGHGIVGAAQGGFGAMAMATFHPDVEPDDRRVRCAREHRLLRHLRGYQQGVLPALPVRRRTQRALRLPAQR